jgi:asparagine synthase (glutamine-hydrolysing)
MPPHPVPNGETWQLALTSTFAKVWISRRDPSQLAFKKFGEGENQGLLIGKDFQTDSRTTYPGSSAFCEYSDRRGAFVAIRVEEAQNCVRVYRDPSGRIPCWRARVGARLVLFSHLEDFISLFRPRLSINWEAIQLHLLDRWFHGRQTCYREVDEILPGEELRIRGVTEAIERLWKPEEIGLEHFPDVEVACTEIRRAVDGAISGWGNTYRRISLDLSGGLDSSIVLGMLRRNCPKTEVVGINYTIKHAEGDERDFARAAAKQYGIELVEQELDPARLQNPPSYKFRLLRPAFRTIPLGYDEVGSLLAQRYRSDAFFTGTGGDHLFYDHVGALASIDHFRERGLPGLISISHQLAQLSTSTIWTALSAVARDWIGLEAPVPAYFKPMNPFINDPPASISFGSDLIHPSINAAWGRLTPAKLQQVCHLVELQCHYWRFGRADVAEEVHPLVSQQLMEASLRTRPDWFCDGGIQRGLARRAFSDVIPPKIAARRTKSSNGSHWNSVIEQNLQYYRDLMFNGVLATHGILNIEACDRMLTPMGLRNGKTFSKFANTLSVEQWLNVAIPEGASVREAA